MANVKNLKRTTKTISAVKAEFLAVGAAEGHVMQASVKALDKKLGGSLTAAIAVENFTGTSGGSVFVYGNADIKRVEVFGIGDPKKLDADALRVVGSKIMIRAQALKVKKVLVDADSFFLTDDSLLQAFAEGLMITGYEFLRYKSKVEDASTVATVEFIGKASPAVLKKVSGLVKGVFLARDVSNHPANIATPAYLAGEAIALGKDGPIKTMIIDESKFEKMGMGAFYGVSRGSALPGKLILMEYNGGKKNQKPFALVGKGLTFDSGGISLKPGANMDEMKFDMCGSATVLGVMKAVSELQPKVNIIAAIGAAENMPDGDAQRPGDIVTAYNGKTIEILNTDAEGRLVLADVLAYVVDKYKPRKMLDFATLTGAVLIALGNRVSGIMGNNDELIGEIKKSSEFTGERVWELPLWDDYFKDIESKIADIKNLGEARMAGTITAGMFLKQFVGETPWCHLDIAGTAWGAKRPDYLPKVGATGVAVRLVYDILENQ